MNIFVLDNDPIIAASYYCDKHVVKMPTEIAQMLCNPFDGDTPYKKTHLNHPASKWVRESRQNYLWTIIHGLEVSRQYTLRYNRVHKSELVIRWCKDNMSRLNFSKEELTPHAICMDDVCRVSEVVESYRNFYIQVKSQFAKWKLGNVPQWYKEKLA